MQFVLLLDLSGVSFYGHIPEFSLMDNEKVEIFELKQSDWSLLNIDFVDAINAVCGTALDDGDVDYLDAAQCEVLSNWLTRRLVGMSYCRLQVIYQRLLDFSDRAISLKTGVVVEF